MTCVLASATETRHGDSVTVRETRAKSGRPSTAVSLSGSQSVSSRLMSKNRTGRPKVSPWNPNRANPAVASLAPSATVTLAGPGGEDRVERGG